MLGAIFIVLLVLPPLVLLAIQVKRVVWTWLKGYHVSDPTETPRASRWASLNNATTRICPGCGNAIPAVSEACEHCRLRFDPTPIHHPSEQLQRS